MAASTRWVSYAVSSVGIAADGDNNCKGTRGYCKATASVDDTFTIGPTTNRLYVNFGTDSGYVTLYSGSNLDPRFIAKDITEKIHAEAGWSSEESNRAICVWENDNSNGNHFNLYSGELGSGSQVTVATSGTNSAHSELGFDSNDPQGGVAGSTKDNDSYTYAGNVSVSGTYYGFHSEVYKIVISNDEISTRGIGTPTKGGSNTYAGVISTGGVYNRIAGDLTYTLKIDTTNGTTMGAGTGNVPKLYWTTGTVDECAIGNAVELLYPDHWYYVGTYGLMVKFTDAVFNTVTTAWTIVCSTPDFAQGSNVSAPVGTAQYVWSSDRGDMSTGPVTTSSGGGYTQLGTRGLTIKFDDGTLKATEEYYVIASGPPASSYNITSLNYGNVTVSTESSLRTVNFEIESGAVIMSTVQFGLQSHGTFSHHDTGSSDTYFRFGTVGPGNNSLGVGDATSIEWYPNITAADIDSDVAPAYLAATEDDLPVVSTSELSESIGNYGLVADPVWLNIRLGSAETGANSTINYRLYFDYS